MTGHYLGEFSMTCVSFVRLLLPRPTPPTPLIAKDHQSADTLSPTATSPFDTDGKSFSWCFAGRTAIFLWLLLTGYFLPCTSPLSLLQSWFWFDQPRPIRSSQVGACYRMCSCLILVSSSECGGGGCGTVGGRYWVISVNLPPPPCELSDAYKSSTRTYSTASGL